MMIGDKLKQVLDYYDTAVNKAGGCSCVCVHGKPGSEKTKLLESVKNKLLIDGANVFFSIGRDKTAKQSISISTGLFAADAAIKEIIRQLLRLYANDYDKEFIDFITSYTKGSLTPGSKDNNKHSLIKFVYDCVHAEPAVLVIDDIDAADAFTINLAGNLLSLGLLQFLIISHTDMPANRKLTDMLYRNTERIIYLQMQGTDIRKTKIDNSSEEDSFTKKQPIPDETMLVLSRSGNERKHIDYLLKTAESYMAQLDYENAGIIYQTALEIYDDLVPADNSLKTDLLIHLGDAQYADSQTTVAMSSYQRAFQATELENIPDKRVTAAIRLAGCFNDLEIPDKAREYIMLSEAFFSVSERRTQFYDLYAKHIILYLYMLAELGEKVIFREKLKQAYGVCRLDDTDFTSSLYCEEAFMLMESGDYTKARDLLQEARSSALSIKSGKLWDNSTGLLAICAGEAGNTELSRTLWHEIAGKSHNPLKIAEAVINAALIDYQYDSLVEKALSHIRNGLDLCTLAGDTRVIEQLYKRLEYTPLAEAFKPRKETKQI